MEQQLENRILTEEEVSRGENIILGDTPYKFIESPGQITFFREMNSRDEKYGEGIILSGDLDNAAIKKDFIEHFKDWASKVNVDVDGLNNHVFKQRREEHNFYKNIVRHESIYTDFKSEELFEEKLKDPSELTFGIDDDVEYELRQNQALDRQLETAKKAGYIQGVCECVAAIGDGYAFGKKLLSEMNVTKDLAKKFANPETYKALEQGIFAPQLEQKHEQTHNIRR